MRGGALRVQFGYGSFTLESVVVSTSLWLAMVRDEVVQFEKENILLALEPKKSKP